MSQKTNVSQYTQLNTCDKTNVPDPTWENVFHWRWEGCPIPLDIFLCHNIYFLKFHTCHKLYSERWNKLLVGSWLGYIVGSVQLPPPQTQPQRKKDQILNVEAKNFTERGFELGYMLVLQRNHNLCNEHHHKYRIFQRQVRTNHNHNHFRNYQPKHLGNHKEDFLEDILVWNLYIRMMDWHLEFLKDFSQS